jgi:ATP-binding cassette subfamily B protein
VALLGRFYDPWEGKIRLDGQDIRKRALKSVRDAVGYAFQDTYLFSDTVARNIAYAELNAKPEEIERAARAAQAQEFIQRLPQKYETTIGEFGARLSGGQRQRLALARAVLHNPRVLVLDDSLSAVDSETEAQIRRALEKVMAHRTVFIITNRIATARRADRILVLENGCITQRGTHDELMQVDGYYRQMAATQFAEAGVGQEPSHMDRMYGAEPAREKALAQARAQPVEEDED